MLEDDQDVLNDLIPDARLAKALHKKPQEMPRWRSQNYGPRYFRTEDGSILYLRRHVLEWLQERLRDPRDPQEEVAR